jgi:HEAT repeat protein
LTGIEPIFADHIEKLLDDCPEVRLGAVMNLGRIGPDAHPAVPLLRDRLEDDSAVVCRAAADALSQIGMKATSSLPRLIEIMREESERGELIRSGMSGGILGGLLPPAPDQIEPISTMLAAALADEHEHSRHAAAYGLSLMGYGISLMGDRAGRIVGSLISALGDGSSGVRYWASAALGEIGPRQVQPHLLTIAGLIRGLDENMETNLLLVMERLGGGARPAVEVLKGSLERLPTYARDFIEGFEREQSVLGLGEV